MVPREVIAHECLAILTTPMLAPFLQAVQAQPQDWCDAAAAAPDAAPGLGGARGLGVRISARGRPAAPEAQPRAEGASG